ncbi:MAG TPA: hypothetical protein VFO38_06350 [Candidatus Saccharimonadales bacterium]|nr:hypothetical protein [Candidatus Saccharimonadales bacterium]
MTQVKAMFLVQQSVVKEADGHLAHRFGDVVKALAHMELVSDTGDLFYFGDVADNGLPFDMYRPPALCNRPQLGDGARLVECLIWLANQAAPGEPYVLSIHADMFVDDDYELKALIDYIPNNFFVLLVPSGALSNDTLCQELQRSLQWRTAASILHLVSDEPIEPTKVTDHITTWHASVVQPVA